MSEITQFFQESCGRALVNAARERDMDLIIYASYGSYSCPFGRNLLSEIGKKNIIHLPDYASFDAIIILPNSFDIHGMDTELLTLVRENATCPVICMQNDFSEKYPEFYSITADNVETLYHMTKHIIEHHGFNDICFMSGPFDAKDSPDRLKGFRQAMDEAGLPVSPNMVFEGNYWMNRGAQALDFFMEGRKTYPQAIICANDFMALSICDELKKRGLKIPEDVAVTGFDGIHEGDQNDPPLTTVYISPANFAEAAIRIIEDVFAGKEPDHLVKVSDEIVFKESCGCHSHGNSPVVGNRDSLMMSIDKDFLLREAGRITGDYQNRNDIANALSVADYYFQSLGCAKGYLCFCTDNEELISSQEERIFSDEMILMQIMRANARMYPEIVEKRFDRSDILPKEYFDTDEPQTYIIFPIHYKNLEYGYLVLNPVVGEWPSSIASTYTNALSSALENSYYQKQFLEFAEIKRMSETDPLTGLYNRRGFENGLSILLSLNERELTDDMHISIASIDMDNLKMINDVYGHSEGDFALRTLANTLLACIDEGEICARFGGDEFSVILITGKPDRIRTFTEQMDSMLAKASEDSGKPYPIHASVGFSELKGRNTHDIIACMQTADEAMYIHKRSYKAEER